MYCYETDFDRGKGLIGVELTDKDDKGPTRATLVITHTGIIKVKQGNKIEEDHTFRVRVSALTLLQIGWNCISVL